MAQFGRALRSGRRSRRFKSCHPDQMLAVKNSLKASRFILNASLGAFLLYVVVIRFIFSQRNAFLREKNENFLPKTGVICEKTLLQGVLKPFRTTSRDFFSNKSRLLWEKINLKKIFKL